ncbi:MAG: Calx-beta domain-containing protein [Verrucomicrobiota bacterium]
MHKNILNWLPDTAIHNVTSNGVYRIYSFDVPNRLNGNFYGAKVRKDFQRDYWIEFREQFTGNRWTQNGVLLNWAPWEQSNGGTQLIDTTPGTPTASDSREDAAVVIGRTFSDEVAGVHITPLGRGVTGSNSWMDVQINSGNFSTNEPPILDLEMNATNVAPGALVRFHAVATDFDGDALAYEWSFDDQTFSTNNLPSVSKSWSTPGEHVVRCVVSDMKGGTISTNAVITVGAATGFRITGRILDNEGNSIEGVRVDNGEITFDNYVGGYTDSDGQYVLVNVPSFLDLRAIKYGFTFSNLVANPIFLSSNLVNVDFIATALPSLSITSTTNAVAENNNATNYFTVTRAGETTNDLTVMLYLSGTAAVSSDYTLTPALTDGLNTMVIPTGESSVTFAFKTINDASIEGPEKATLTILDDPLLVPIPSYTIGALGEATITILDDDLAVKPSVAVTPVSPGIPENGMDRGTFLFSRTGSTQNSLTVFYSAGGTATAGTDYGSLLGVVIIPAGSSSTAIQFQTIDDKILETNETVVVTLNADPTYTVTGLPAQITIVDDDLLTVTVFPTLAKAAEPSAQGRFTVKREGDLRGNLLVNYTVSGTATAGIDYISLSGSVTIPAAATSADIVLTPLDDLLLEGDESVIVTLTTTAGYNIGTPGSGKLLIRDNEKVSVTISAPDGLASEPGDDTGQFQISRGSVFNGDLTVYLAINGTAIPGSDYIPLDSVVVIPDGANSVTLDVIAFDDLHHEPVEDVILTLLPNTNYNVGSSPQAKVVIVDNDDFNVPAVGFTFATSSAPENQSPGLSISLSATSTAPISVDFRVLGGTATNSDYSMPVTTLTFAPGEWAKSLPLEIVNDSIVEPNETIRVALFNPINATLDGIKIHTYTIIDDDLSAVSVVATSPNASETGPAPGNFRVTRSGSTNANLQVNFQITGTASAPADYGSLGNSVVIPAGVAFVDLPVVPVNDQTVEYAETVQINLLTAPGAKIVSPNVATVTITDNDLNTLPTVTVTSTNRPAAVEGGGNGEFVFTRNGTSGVLTVYFSITGTASSGVDFLPLGTNIVIANGQSSATLPVTAIDDGSIEGEETVVLALTVRDTYLTAFPSSATVLVQDNDQRVWVDANDFFAAEPGTDTAGFTFTRFGTTNTDLKVFFSVSGTASNGVDYVAITNSFTIPAGSLSATLSIVPIDDLLLEGPETVTLTLSGNPAYTLGSPTNATITLQDDEPMLTLTATLTNIVEGSKPSTAFRITRTGDPRYSFNALLAVGGTASYGIDYPAFLTNVYFSCGVISIDLPVSPFNELVAESEETVTARLLPSPAYTILSPSNAVIAIIDAGTNNNPVVTITSPTVKTVYLPGTNVGILLQANVTDDNDTNTPLLMAWSKISGPDSLVFGDSNAANTTVIFTNAGVYVLRFTADDGLLQSYAEVTAVVGGAEYLATNRLHWALDESAGAGVSDSSGFSRNGTRVGSSDWTNGILGGAAQLHGANDYIRQTSGSNVLNGAKAFTLSLWINSANPNASQGFFSASDTGTNTTLSLSTRTIASCGQYTNVIEATMATTYGQIRHISASNKLTNGWEHIALTWSNGLAPALYINGELDQPLSQFVSLRGTLVNCPEFLIGQGPVGGPPSWNGAIDDVRVFSRALSAGEVAALSALPRTNFGPVVFAGPDTTLQLTAPMELAGVVTDDGKPNPPGLVNYTWSSVSSPAPVVFTNTSILTNTVQFSQPGEYVFRLVGDDGQVKVFDDVTNTVIEPTQVYVFASDSEAAELGPDNGQFTFFRFGDLTVDLPVLLTISGTSSNGIDFMAVTNAITFPAGMNAVTMDIVPFLDDRIEGDESLTFTIVSNLAYTIASGEATVTIHDSPYGAWSVQHFTLEELTFPDLSGATGDFDHDGVLNYVEYAVNHDPKTADTNSALTATIELNPADSQNHVTLTYPRRLAPTDTAYNVYISHDLLTWNTGPAYIEEIQATDDGNGKTETVKARLLAPYSASTNWFITVRVRLLITGP